MELYKVGSKGAMVKRIQQAVGCYPDGVFGKLTEESVKSWQLAHGLIPDGIVGVKTLAKMFPQVLGLKKSKRRIDLILVHCTATAEGKDFTVEDIRRWHTTPKPKGNGWSDIGYHYVIYRDGTIHEGRSVDISGAHCEGWNAHSIGVVYVGGCEKDGKTPKDTRTDEQKSALLSLLMDLRKLYPDAKIAGHRDYDKKGKKCPSFDAKTEYRNI
jgi:N-acetylmuramoyl-L-alanine amidase